MCVITAYFKGTPNPIVISWEHWGMQVIKGQEDQELTRGLGLLSHQKIEIVILEWWTWWRWLMRSPTAWKASLEGLKVLTLVPNPIGISPQTHMTCGEEGYSCISITTCPCINTSYVVWLCLVVCLLVVWVDNWLFVCFCINCFYIVGFYHYFLCVKNPKTHKK